MNLAEHTEQQLLSDHILSQAAALDRTEQQLMLDDLASHTYALGRRRPLTPAQAASAQITLGQRRRQLQVRQAELGDRHVTTLGCLNALAMQLADMGEMAEALPMLRHVLEEVESTLGAEFPEVVLAVLDNLIGCLLDVGQVEEALPLAQRAFDIGERTGADKGEQVNRAGSVVDCLSKLGRSREAMPLMRRFLFEPVSPELEAQRAAALQICLGIRGQTRAAILARRQAVRQGASPAGAAAAAAASAAPPPPRVLEPGSAAWIEEWAPAAVSRGRRGGGCRRRPGRQAGGRGRDQARPAAPPASPHPAAPVDEGLDPLPPGLVARPWAELRVAHLGGSECAICLEALAGAGAGTVVQLRCRHSYCELCVRQLLQLSSAGASCPECRGNIE